jgi:hypothetical protein
MIRTFFILFFVISLCSCLTSPSAAVTGGSLASIDLDFGEPVTAPALRQFSLRQGSAGSTISLSGSTITALSNSTYRLAFAAPLSTAAGANFSLVYDNRPADLCAPPALTPTPAATPTTTTVGDGTAGSCTEAALRAAVATGGLIRFACGGISGGAAALTTISVAGAPFAIDTNVTIVGGSVVAIVRASGTSGRLFEISRADPADLSPVLRLEGLRLVGGDVSGLDANSVSQPTSGSGGAVYHRGGVVEILDCDFAGSRGTSTGKDAGGGAIYTFGGSLTVERSTFLQNFGSNAGAIGVLGAKRTVTIRNSLFWNNQATGVDGNSESGGSGGNGGAIAMDGRDYSADICGCGFHRHTQNFLGTVFRVGYTASDSTTLSKCEVIASACGPAKADCSAAALYLQGHSVTLSEVSLLYNRAGRGFAAAQLVAPLPLAASDLLVYGNVAGTSLAGGIALPSSGGGTMARASFLNNSALFAAAFTASSGSAITLSDSVFADNVATNGFNPVTASNPMGPCSGTVLQFPATRSGGGSDTASPVCSGGAAVVFANASFGVPRDEGCAVLSARASPAPPVPWAPPLAPPSTSPRAAPSSAGPPLWSSPSAAMLPPSPPSTARTPL